MSLINTCLAKLTKSRRRFNLRLNHFVLFIILALLQAESARSFPLTSSRPWVVDYGIELLGEGFSFDGIVAMSNCSASFVRLKGSSEDSRGLIMTNGHCVGGGSLGGMLGPGEIVYQSPKRFVVSLLDKKASRIASLRADKIVYATMTDTDLALLELTQTYREIREMVGVDPLEIDDRRPTEMSKIEIPSGYWARTYSCTVEAFVPNLKESKWMFKDSIRYSATGCEVIGGTSGSPIVDATSGRIVGINNTVNESGGRCTMNNPCEIDDNGNVSFKKGRGYGQQVFRIYSCMNAALQFDLSVPTCMLPKGQRAPWR